MSFSGQLYFYLKDNHFWFLAKVFHYQMQNFVVGNLSQNFSAFSTFFKLSISEASFYSQTSWKTILNTQITFIFFCLITFNYFLSCNNNQ